MNALITLKTKITADLLIFPIAGLILLLTACGSVPANQATPEPTPDLHPTLEALMNQRMAKIQQDAMNAEIKRRVAEMLAATPTPSPTSTPTVTPIKAPTPTPISRPMPVPPAKWATYRNSEYGYSISVAPGWAVDEAVKHQVIVDGPGQIAWLEVTSAVMPKFLQLSDEFRGELVNRLIELRRGQSHALFELTSHSNLVLPSGLAATRFTYRGQETPNDCVFHRSEALAWLASQAYRLTWVVCEGDLVVYKASLEAMQNSFVVFTPTPGAMMPTPMAMPSPSPTPT